MAKYQVYSGAMPTTAALAAVSTGTSIKTLVQLKASATKTFKIVEWGVSFDGSAAATPIKVELLETDAGGTATGAYVTADIHKLDADALAGGDPLTNLFQTGTAAGSGYNLTAEGAITTVREFDAQLVAPTNQYIKQYPLGAEPVVQVGKFARIRVTAGASVNAYAYITVEV